MVGLALVVATTIFADDFNDGSLDPAWAMISQTQQLSVVEGGGVLTISGVTVSTGEPQSGIVACFDFEGDAAATVDMRLVEWPQAANGSWRADMHGLCNCCCVLDSTDQNAEANGGFNATDGITGFRQRVRNGSGTFWNDPGVALDSAWHTMRVEWRAGMAQAFMDGAPLGQPTPMNLGRKRFEIKVISHADASFVVEFDNAVIEQLQSATAVPLPEFRSWSEVKRMFQGGD